MTNPQHYHNIDREPHAGDRARIVLAPGRFGEEFTVNETALAQVGNGWPSQFDLVQPWWDVDAKPGAKWHDRAGDVWTKRDNGRWTINGSAGGVLALPLDAAWGPGELVTPEPSAPEPEPTAPGVVVRGTIDGKTVRAVRADGGALSWLLYGGGLAWPRWVTFSNLLARFDSAPTIIDTDQPTGLTDQQAEAVRLTVKYVEEHDGEIGTALLREVFPEVFAEPEPGADIPDEVVKVALEVLEAAHVETINTKAWDSMRTMRAALAAADAKRTELEEQA